MDLVNRLKLFMETKGIAISQFADTCSIPRPTMSQILNGRNKKISDELISKIHFAYPELSVLWLMFGEGDMTTTANSQTSEPLNADSQLYSGAQATENETGASGNNLHFHVSDFGADNSADRFVSEFPNLGFNGAPSQHTAEGNRQEFRSQSTTTADSLIDFEALNGDGRQPLSDETARPQARQDSPLNANRSTAQMQSPSESAANADSDDSASNLRSVNLLTAPNKRITNIVVFYSDNSFQSFYPAML